MHLFTQAFVILMADSLLTELGNTQDYLLKVNASSCTSQQADLWAQKLSRFGFSGQSGVASEFVDKVKGGPWTQQQKELLLSAINEGLTSGSENKSPKRGLQTVTDFGAYFSKRDLAILVTLKQALLPRSTRWLYVWSRLACIVARSRPSSLFLPMP